MLCEKKKKNEKRREENRKTEKQKQTAHPGPSSITPFFELCTALILLLSALLALVRE